MKRAIAKTEARNDFQTIHHLNRVSVFNKGWQSVVWGSKYSSPRLPIEKAAPCCGHQCGSCADDPDSKFWCEGPMKDAVRPSLVPASLVLRTEYLKSEPTILDCLVVPDY